MSRSWLPIALVAVLVVAAVGILASGSQPAYGPVVETVRQGDFELTLRADKGRYTPSEPIEIEARLTYRGPEPEVQIVYARAAAVLGATASPILFVIREPVFGITPSGVWEASRNRATLARDVPLVVPFAKSSGSLATPLDDFQAWLAEPGLELPSGAWHIAAIAEFSVGDVEGFKLEAEIAITVGSAPTTESVPPSPTEFANPAQSVTVRDGDIELTIRSGKTRYTTDEAVDVSASLVYRGSEAAVDVWGGLAPIYSRETRGGVTVGFTLVAMCSRSTYERGVRLEETIQTSRETAGRVDIEPVPLLPPGTWHLYVTAQTCAPGSEPDAIEFALEAEITIEVEAADPVPTEIANPPQQATVRDGDFELSIHPDKSRYMPNEAIDLTTSLAYVGSEGFIEIGHNVGSGPLFVAIREPVYGVELQGMTRLACTGSTLQTGVPLSESGLAGEFAVPDGPADESFRAFFFDPVLRLPVGTWHVYAQAQTMCMGIGPSTTLEAEITIVVSADPLATPGFAGPTPAQDTRQLPVSDEQRTDDWRLILSSARTEYRTGEPISVTVAISYVGPEPSIEMFGSSSGPYYLGVHEIGGLGRGTTTGLYTDLVSQGVMQRGDWRITQFPSLLDPWLPTGTWELSATTGGGSVPELAARIVVNVTE